MCPGMSARIILQSELQSLYTCKHVYMKPEVKLILGYSVPGQNIAGNEP